MFPFQRGRGFGGPRGPPRPMGQGFGFGMPQNMMRGGFNGGPGGRMRGPRPDRGRGMQRGRGGGPPFNNREDMNRQPEVKRENVAPNQDKGVPPNVQLQTGPPAAAGASTPAAPSTSSQRQPAQPGEHEPEYDTSLCILDWYDSDLNLKISESNNFCSAEPLSNGGFAYMWAGARASYGATKGRVCYEVKIDKNLCTDHLQNESNPHVLRVGWSLPGSHMQLGEVKHSYGYGGTAKISENCKFKNYGIRFGVNDVIATYLDMTSENCCIKYTVNGKDMGIAFRFQKKDLKGKGLFPHILTKNQAFTVNFGQLPAPMFPILQGYSPIGQLDVEDGVVRGPLPPASKQNCEVLMMIGLPGAGKTFWAEKFASENADKNWNILGTNNLIEKMKVEGLPRKRNYHGRWEQLIKDCTQCFNQLLGMAAKRRRNFILDQTNVYPTARGRKIKDFAGYKAKAVVVVPKDEEFRRRVAEREAIEGKDVPDEAVLNMKCNFVLPEVEEAYFTEVLYTELPPADSFEQVNRYNEEAMRAGIKMVPGVQSFKFRNEGKRKRQNIVLPGRHINQDKTPSPAAPTVSVKTEPVHQSTAGSSTTPDIKPNINNPVKNEPLSAGNTAAPNSASGNDVKLETSSRRSTSRRSRSRDRSSRRRSRSRDKDRRDRGRSSSRERYRRDGDRRDRRRSRDRSRDRDRDRDRNRRRTRSRSREIKSEHHSWGNQHIKRENNQGFNEGGNYQDGYGTRGGRGGFDSRGRGSWNGRGRGGGWNDRGGGAGGGNRDGFDRSSERGAGRGAFNSHRGYGDDNGRGRGSYDRGRGRGGRGGYDGDRDRSYGEERSGFDQNNRRSFSGRDYKEEFDHHRSDHGRGGGRPAFNRGGLLGSKPDNRDQDWNTRGNSDEYDNQTGNNEYFNNANNFASKQSAPRSLMENIRPSGSSAGGPNVSQESRMASNNAGYSGSQGPRGDRNMPPSGSSGFQHDRGYGSDYQNTSDGARTSQDKKLRDFDEEFASRMERKLAGSDDNQYADNYDQNYEGDWDQGYQNYDEYSGYDNDPNGYDQNMDYQESSYGSGEQDSRYNYRQSSENYPGSDDHNNHREQNEYDQQNYPPRSSQNFQSGPSHSHHPPQGAYNANSRPPHSASGPSEFNDMRHNQAQSRIDHVSQAQQDFNSSKTSFSQADNWNQQYGNDPRKQLESGGWGNTGRSEQHPGMRGGQDGPSSRIPDWNKPPPPAASSSQNLGASRPETYPITSDGRTLNMGYSVQYHTGDSFSKDAVQMKNSSMPSSQRGSSASMQPHQQTSKFTTTVAGSSNVRNMPSNDRINDSSAIHGANPAAPDSGGSSSTAGGPPASSGGGEANSGPDYAALLQYLQFYQKQIGADPKK